MRSLGHCMDTWLRALQPGRLNRISSQFSCGHMFARRMGGGQQLASAASAAGGGKRGQPHAPSCMHVQAHARPPAAAESGGQRSWGFDKGLGWQPGAINPPKDARKRTGQASLHALQHSTAPLHACINSTAHLRAGKMPGLMKPGLCLPPPPPSPALALSRSTFDRWQACLVLAWRGCWR